jgi:hypothetical protein
MLIGVSPHYKFIINAGSTSQWTGNSGENTLKKFKTGHRRI